MDLIITTGTRDEILPLEPFSPSVVSDTHFLKSSGLIFIRIQHQNS
jgi:hypothetical protein